MPFDIYNKEFQNWLKGVFGLNTTKTALCECISDKLDNVLSSNSYEELHQYFLCLKANNISLLTTKSKGSKDKRWECEHKSCGDLMRYFINNHKQEHKLKYTWAPIGTSERFVTTDGGYHCKELKWNVIKLYMHIEKEDVIKQFTSFDCLDITHVIKIIRNCKFISTNDLDEPLEEVLASRNKFMHSPDNKMTDSETCKVVQCTRKLLDCLDIAEKTYYKKAVQELQDLSENDFILRYQSEDCKRILADVLNAKHLADELYSAIKDDNQVAQSRSKRLQDMLESIAGLRPTSNTRLEMKLAEYKRISKEFLEKKIDAIVLDQTEFDTNSVEYKKMEDLKERTERTVKVVIEQIQRLEPEEMVDEIEKLRKEKESLKHERKQYIEETLPALANKTMSDVFERYSDFKIFQSPQCLLETDDDMHLSIVEETAEELKQINLPVNVVAITGLYRTGKSYLMNVLAGETSGFGSGIQSKTKGIWAWCKKHPTQKGQVLLLLDTEGLGDVEKGSPDHDNKIFIIAALLSSTLVYNVMTAFNQDAVEKLTFITNLSENLRVSVSNTSDDDFDLIMPEFVLCIRDFTLDLEIDGKEITADQYLEHCLRGKSTGNKMADEKYNRPRHCIKKYFTKRKAFTFDRPASKKIMKILDKAKKEDLSSDFIEETQNFQKFIYERRGKILETKRPVTVRMLVELLCAYIKAIKDGKVPCIDDALTVMSKEENKKHAKDAIDTFRVDLGKLHLPVGNKAKLLEEKFEIQTSVLKNLNSKLLLDDDHFVEMSVQSEMDRIFNEFETENDRLLYEKCMKRITDIYEKEVKGNIDGNIYLVSGGYDKYKNDMLRVKEMYETELDHERIDRMQTNKAMRDFVAQRYAESEAIMTADKSISEDEINAEMETQKKKLETQEKEIKRLADELEKLRKQQM